MGAALSVAFLAAGFLLDWAPAWRLLVFLPAFLAAQGFLQAAFHFCVGFAQRGLFNFGELGTEESVHQAEYRRQDQRKALQITGFAFVIAAVVAVVAFLA